MGTWPFPWQKNRNPFVIPPGSLRYQVAVQAPSQTPDSVGGITTTWNPVLTCMAAILTLAQREIYQQGQFTAQVSHQISMYWPGASIVIQGGMRVLYGARTFLIQTPENVQERNRVLLLHCLEINPQQ